MSLFSRRVDKQLEAYQRELVDTHYKEVDNMYRQMRGWRHDYRNHIQMLKALAAKGDMNGINDYLNMLDTDLNTVDLAIKTGNPMDNKQQGIPCQGQGHNSGNRRAYSR